MQHLKSRDENFVVVGAHSDSDWAGCHSSRLSRTVGYVEADWSSMCCVNCRQDAPALSSAEAEWCAAARLISEALGLRAVLQHLGYEVRVVWYCDVSAARVLSRRQGVGGVKRLAMKTLWIQHLATTSVIVPRCVPTLENKADLRTKANSAGELAWLKKLVGIGLMNGRVPSVSKVPVSSMRTNTSMVHVIEFLLALAKSCEPNDASM